MFYEAIFRQYGRLTLALAAVLAFCAVLPLLFQQSRSIETGSWGLSFRTEGQPPVGNASKEALRRYDAVYLGDETQKKLYLTFDAGYENGCTEPILEALAKHNVKAAFFVVGNYIEQNPDLVRRMLREGHIVGNHTYHHYDMSKLSDEAAFNQELTSLETLYRETTGEDLPRYYRPPQGIYSEKILKWRRSSATGRYSGRWPTSTGIRTTSRPTSRRFPSSCRASIRARSCCCTPRRRRTRGSWTRC